MLIVREDNVYKDVMCKNKYNHIDDWYDIIVTQTYISALNTNSEKNRSKFYFNCEEEQS